MLSNSFNNASAVLVQTIFNLYLYIILLRIILQRSGASYHNPISQFVIKLTNPVIIPLRKIIPSFRGIDIASLVFLFTLEIVKLIILIWLITMGLQNILGLLLWALVDILELLINIYFYAIIIAAILSWIRPIGPNPLYDALYLMTEPLLRPVRRLIPPVAGFDLSPVVVLLILHLTDMIVIQNLLLPFAIRLQQFQ